MKEIINKLMELSDKAYELNEVPISAVVVKGNKIIGSGYNKRISLNDVTAHAEVLALKEAAATEGDWRLNDCDLYVTLEPCNMCKEIIKESRIRNVYYMVKKDDFKKGFYKTNICSIDEQEYTGEIEEYKNKLNEFFESKR